MKNDIYAGLGQDNHVGMYGDFIDTLRRAMNILKGKIIIFSSRRIIEEAKSHYPEESAKYSLKSKQKESDVFDNEYDVIVKSELVLGWYGIYKDDKIKITDLFDNELKMEVFW